MDPEAAIALLVGAATMAVSLLILVWKLGRWQAETKERADAFNTKLDEFIKRADKDISEAHRRIDRHIESHP